MSTFMSGRTRAYSLISTGALLGLCFLRAQDSPKPGQVELVVVDSKTKEPVGGATIELDRIRPLPLSVRHASSDEHGQAKFPQVEPGLYWIASIHVDGYTYDPPDTRSS